MVLGGAVLVQLIGALWYGPLFGKLWMRAWGKTEADLKMTGRESRFVYGGSFIAAVLMCSMLYLAASSSVVSSTSSFAFAISVAIMVAWIAGISSIPSYLFERRPLLMWGVFYTYVSFAYGLIAFVYASFA